MQTLIDTNFNEFDGRPGIQPVKLSSVDNVLWPQRRWSVRDRLVLGLSERG